MFQSIFKVIEESNNIVILSHAAPDGDSVGSSLALYNYLINQSKNVKVIIDDDVPYIYEFLKGADKIERVNGNDGFDLALVLDSSDTDRLGKSSKYLSDKTIVNIDHHKSNDEFGTYNIVDTNAAATTEIIYDFLETLNVKIDKAIAECLYVGIVTDTGRFQYSNTTAKTHMIAEKLINLGVEPARIFMSVYQNNSKEKIRLVAQAIKSLEFYCDDRISSMVLTEDDFIKTGAKDEDTEGIINYGRDIISVELSLLFKESSDNKVKVSFRSKDNIDVNIFAGKFGGGGHKSAAGATIHGDIDTVKRSVLDKAFELYRVSIE